MFSDASIEAVEASDCVVALATELGEPVHFGRWRHWHAGEANRKWIYVQQDPTAIGVHRPIDVPLVGDVRAVPVLTGTLRHEHAPIRIGAIVSFAALGPEGHGGMLQGLEDTSREVQRIVLSVILARDLRAFRKGEPPELLATALSSQRPEVRFAAARAAFNWR